MVNSQWSVSLLPVISIISIIGTVVVILYLVVSGQGAVSVARGGGRGQAASGRGWWFSSQWLVASGLRQGSVVAVNDPWLLVRVINSQWSAS